MSRTHDAGTRRVLRVGSLCTGYGGLDLGVAAALGDGRLRWCADDDPHVARVLAARFPGVPNLGDVTGVDWRSVDPVDVVTAGFPCQDISAAGQGRGIERGTRSGVWIDVLEAVRVLRPRLLIVENVAALRWRGLGRVLGDLAEAGYDASWCSVRASDIGAPHRRERVFVAAHPAGARLPRLQRLRPAPAGRSGAQRRGLPEPATEPRRESAAVQPLPRLESTTPDTEGERRHEGKPEPARLEGRPDLAVRGRADPRLRQAVDWGPYEPAIRRWEDILGRPAPPPTEAGGSGRPRLSPRFVEWVMGLDEGWVTGLDLPRTAQLRALGNGVVPQQAAYALHVLAQLEQAQKPAPSEPGPSLPKVRRKAP